MGHVSMVYVLYKNDLLVKDFLESNLSIEDRIKQFDDVKSPFYSIIKDESYLKDSLWKNLYDYGNIIILMEKERAQANYCIFMNGTPYPKHELNGGWKTPWRYDNLLYCNHTHYDLTIDYLFDEANGYRVLIWSGNTNRLFLLKGYQRCNVMALKNVTKEQKDGFQNIYLTPTKQKLLL